MYFKTKQKKRSILYSYVMIFSLYYQFRRMSGVFIDLSVYNVYFFVCVHE